jgi:acetyl-CoA carboxylase biotin carboxyl carrier protein
MDGNRNAESGEGKGSMDETNLEKLGKLVEFLKANEIAEYEAEHGGDKVRIKFATPASEGIGGIDSAQLARLLASAPSGGSQAAVAAVHHAPEAQAAPEAALHQVKSPIVGTFYDSPSPGSAAFVKPGDIVEIGQVLCIVEAMKLMNEIESDVAGEVVQRIAASGQPVEYGQPLFSIKAI